MSPEEIVSEEVVIVAGEERAEPSWLWWLVLIVGIVSTAVGIVVVLKPSDSLATLAVIFGIFLLVDGIGELIASFGHTVQNRALAAILGVLGIVIGIALIRHPFHGVAAIGLLIGIWLVAAGVIRLIRAIFEGTHLLLRVLVALLEALVGIAIVANPHIGYATLAVIAGIWLILSGIGTMALGFAIRRTRTS